MTVAADETVHTTSVRYPGSRVAMDGTGAVVSVPDTSATRFADVGWTPGCDDE